MEKPYTILIHDKLIIKITKALALVDLHNTLKRNTSTILNKSAGHGSDILSPRQYHNVLAFNIYKQGTVTTTNNKIKTRVALIDLAPTILDFLHLHNPNKRWMVFHYYQQL